ncbi:MAG: hypothetical protein ABI318_20695, partial [Chthoniobacteraceae bacterium]
MTLLARLILATLCIACWFTPASQAQTPKVLPRVAVIAASEDKDVTSLADLLTAAMSHASQGYEMIERTELNRIALEAEVQAMSAAERPRALARLARADGLLLLSMEPSENGRKSISARLSSTGSGFILQTFMLASEAKELPTAAKLAADALRFAAARIGKVGDAVPHIVSLLGIRASTSSSPGVAMEATLNTAITHYLSNTAGFGVVERWKLDDVAFERSLSEKDMPALSTGTVLVDGSLEVKDKNTTARVRIRKSQADPGKILRVESPADDILALAKAIVMKVTAESGAVISQKSWD